MEKKNFLIVIDTTDAKTRVNINKGMLNTFVIRALDPIHAKKIVLGMFPKGISDQLSDGLYVYDMDQINFNIKSLDEQNKMPVFSFMPLNGSRPPKQNDVQITTLGNQTLAANTSHNAPNPRNPPAGLRGGSRSQEFHDIERSRPNTTDKLTKEQADLVSSLGVHPSRSDSDEGVNLRVNASTGVNHNLTGRVPQQNLNNEQADLLARLNVNIPQPIADPELMRELSESGVPTFIDEGLTTINETPLDDATLKRLENE